MAHRVELRFAVTNADGSEHSGSKGHYWNGLLDAAFAVMQEKIKGLLAKAEHHHKAHKDADNENLNVIFTGNIDGTEMKSIHFPNVSYRAMKAQEDANDSVSGRTERDR